MQIANDTARSLGEIVGSVNEVSHLVAQIASASSGQAEGIRQVNQGLRQVDQVTQQTTASAEEGAAASEELSGQAAALRDVTSEFELRQVASPREASGLAMEITPELLAALQAYVAAAGLGGEGPSADGLSSRSSGGRAAATSQLNILDDSEFGRY